jgi:16S rRNA (uracil1498-N3)-methyltransferase
MKRIYIEDFAESRYELRGNYHHYLKNVLRSREGGELEVLTGAELLNVRITEINNKYASLERTDGRPLKPCGYRLSVFQCVLKREYMDFVVEKYAELGVTEITPVLSSRSMRDVKDKAFDRYKEIAIKAVLQSENEHVPVINEPVELAELTTDRAEKLFFYERKEGRAPLELAGKDVAMIIGPEGGFEVEEAETLVSKGFEAVSPFTPVLKAETAAVVFTGLVRMELE